MKKLILQFIILLLLTAIIVSSSAATLGKEIESIYDLVYVLIISAILAGLELVALQFIEKIIVLFKKDKKQEPVQNTYRKNTLVS